jgi:hypothetical protein
VYIPFNTDIIVAVIQTLLSLIGRLQLASATNGITPLQPLMLVKYEPQLETQNPFKLFPAHVEHYKIIDDTDSIRVNSCVNETHDYTY